MRFIGRRFTRKRRLAVAAAAGAMAFAVPISGASAATSPWGFLGRAFTPIAFPLATTPILSQLNGPSAISGCGVNRPSVGATGTTSAESCMAVLSFIGPAIGQVNSQVGPTIIGSTILAPVTVTAGSVVNTVP